MKTHWNKRQEPISERLRDPDEILTVTNKKTMMYNPRTAQTALVMEVFLVDQDDQSIENGYIEASDDDIKIYDLKSKVVLSWVANTETKFK